MIVTANMLTPRIRTGITSRVKASLAGILHVRKPILRTF